MNQSEKIIKKKYIKNTERKRAYYRRNKSTVIWVEKFHQQIREGSHFKCIVCHLCLYQRSVKIHKNDIYSVLTSELLVSVKSFHDKTYACETCHEHLLKCKILCQAICTKKELYPIPNQLKIP